MLDTATTTARSPSMSSYSPWASHWKPLIFPLALRSTGVATGGNQPKRGWACHAAAERGHGTTWIMGDLRIAAGGSHAGAGGRYGD